MELTPSSHVDTFARDNLPPQELWPTFEFTIPEVQYPDRLNAATALIDEPTQKFGGDRVALVTPEGESWTYAQLLARANQIAHVFVEDYGIVPGNRIMLRAPNNPMLVAAWLATLKVGAVVVTTMPLLRNKEVAELIALTQPALAVVDHRFVKGIEVAAAESELTVIVYNGEGEQDLVRLMATKPETFQNVETAADDVALLGPTSGTTGQPKATMHFHRDILANADTFARFLVQPTPEDRWACSAPFAFTFGLGCLVVFPLYFGSSSLLTEMLPPVQLAEAAQEAGVTIMATAPTAWRAILKEGKGDLLSHLRIGISAGEHLPQPTWEAVYRETGLKLLNGLGGTELLHVYLASAGDDIKPGAVGKPVPGFRAAILDVDGNEVPDGEVGRLAVIGPTGCRYLNDQRQRNYVLNGWNVTGDTFLRDEDGYYVYQARSDNMIVSSGYNIGAPEVEIAIEQHPDVLETAVVGKPDEDRGTLVCAFIVLRNGVVGGPAKAKEIQDFVKQQIAPYKYPRDVRFVDELPKNPSGKLQHYKLRQQLAAQAAQSETGVEDSDAAATSA